MTWCSCSSCHLSLISDEEIRMIPQRRTVQDPHSDLVLLQLLPFVADLGQTVAQVRERRDVQPVAGLHHGEKTAEFRIVQISAGISEYRVFQF